MRSRMYGCNYYYKYYKQIPNALCVLRIILSVLMLLLIKDSTPFIILYILCGVSDSADGLLARALKCETQLGAKLDSFADLCFFGILCYVLAFHIPMNLLIIYSVAVIVIIRLLNVILTKIKFKQFAVIHTYLNKGSGFLLFMLYPILLVSNSFVSIASLYTVIVFSLLSSLEELLIILKISHYNINLKSIILIIKNKSID